MFGILKKNKNNEKMSCTGKGKILALMNQKGGVGKTTMAFNLAHALAHEGNKVLCIDMDPQFNLSLMFDVRPDQLQHNIFHLLINSVRELRTLHSDIMLTDVLVKKGKIDLLPAGQDLSGFELTVSGISSPRQLILKKFIQNNDLTHIYDYIVIDGPPTLGLLVVNILCSVNGVLFPFIPDSFSEQGLRNIYQTVMDIDEMGITETPKILGYVPNLFDTRRKQSIEDFDHIVKMVGDEACVFEPFLNRAAMARSMANNKSVFDFSSQEYKSLQQQFLAITNNISNQLEL